MLAVGLQLQDSSALPTHHLLCNLTTSPQCKAKPWNFSLCFYIKSGWRSLRCTCCDINAVFLCLNLGSAAALFGNPDRTCVEGLHLKIRCSLLDDRCLGAALGNEFRSGLSAPPQNSKGSNHKQRTGRQAHSKPIIWAHNCRSKQANQNGIDGGLHLTAKSAWQQP